MSTDESYYREGIKVDTDPKNDYDDGYNAGRRWAKRHHKLWAVCWFAIGMAVEFVLVQVAK